MKLSLLLLLSIVVIQPTILVAQDYSLHTKNRIATTRKHDEDEEKPEDEEDAKERYKKIKKKLKKMKEKIKDIEELQHAQLTLSSIILFAGIASVGIGAAVLSVMLKQSA